jgi:WD40 repeat protein/tRNA A-37 threonylcarbamoyl transferase component Bud32
MNIVRLERRAQSATRDVLFFVYAVQLGYASADQVLAAAGAWATDRSRAFVDRLAFEASLTDAQRARLLELVGETEGLAASRDRATAPPPTTRRRPDADAAWEIPPGDQPELSDAIGSIDGVSPTSPTVDGLVLDPFPEPSALLAPLPELGPPLADIGGTGHSQSPDLADIGGLATLDAVAPRRTADGGLHALSRTHLDRVTAEAPGRYVYRAPDTGERTEDRSQAELGRGGIGRVLAAYDDHVGRDVALKELLLEADGGSGDGRVNSREHAGAAARFLREARVTGQLEHPNIVPVYEVGCRADGTLYYTMRLVRGRTLEEALAAALTLEARLGLLHHFIDLCQAVAYAHSRGVVHRDLKPSNVMVGEFGETLLLDWGLAKVAGQKDIRGGDLQRGIQLLQDAPSGATMDGSALGTPAYMSPEAAIGEIEQVDERSDVWGLGAILYEILTGQPPFSGATPFEIIGQVIKDPIRPVLQRSIDAPAELAAVAEKALHRAKKKRYASARDLAAEVSAFMAGQRVGAYTYTSKDLLKRFASRHKLALAVAAVAVVALAAVGVASYRGVLEERDLAQTERENASLARDASEVAGLRAAAQRDEARRRLAEVLAEKARVNADQAHTVLAEIHAAAALLADERPDARGVLAVTFGVERPRLTWQTRRGVQCAAMAEVAGRDGATLLCAEATGLGLLAWDLASGGERLRLDGHDGGLTALAVGPGGRVLSAGSDGTARVWDPAQAKELLRLEGHAGAVTAAGWTSSGDVITGGADGTVRRWDGETGAAVAQVAAHEGGVGAVVALGDGGWLSAGSDGRLRRWGATSRAPAWSADAHPEAISALALSRDGLVAATGGADGRVRSWDVATGRELGPARVLAGPVGALVFAPGGGVVSADGTGAVRAWEASPPDAVRTLATTVEAVVALALSADGVTVSASTRGADVFRWRLADGAPVSALHGHQRLVESLDFSSDGAQLLSVGGRASVRLRDRVSGLEVARLFAAGSPPWNAAFSPDGAQVAAGASDGSVRFVDLASGAESPSLAAHAGVTMSVSYSPDGGRLATSGSDGVVAVWDLANHQLLSKHSEHTSRAARVRFSPDGTRLVSGGHDNAALVFDPGSSEVVARLSGHSDWVRDVAWSPDGRRVVTASDDFSARVWDAATGEELTRLQGHAGRVFAAVFSLDGATVFTGSEDRTVRVWDALSGIEITRLIGHAAEIRSLALAPDGRSLASGDAAAVVRLWDVPPLRAQSRFQGSAIIRSLAVSPDAALVAAEGQTGAVWVWDLATAEVIARLPDHSGMIEAVAFSPSGELLATSDQGGAVRLWTARTGALAWQATAHKGSVTRLAFSPDGATLFSASEDETVRAWQVATGQSAPRFEGHTGSIYALALSHDGALAATSANDHTLRLWRAATGEPVATVDPRTRVVSAAAFSPDGRQIATTSFEGDVRLWSVPDGALVTTLVGAAVRSHALAFSPDGALLVVAYSDGHLDVWDLASAKVRLSVAGHHAYSPVVFVPGGQTVASSTLDHRIRFYGLAALAADPAEVLRSAEAAFGVTLDGTRVVPDPAQQRTRLIPTR